MNRTLSSHSRVKSSSHQNLNRNASRSAVDILSNPAEEQSSASSNDLKYLKLLCDYVSKNSEEIGLVHTLQWRVKDLDTLSSDDMLRIVVSLLKDINMQNQKINNIKPLEGEVNLLGMITYDSGIDEIYHEVKKLFPPNDNLFHYSVLLSPGSKPQRTKAVLSYLLQFYIYTVDLWNDHLQKCYAEVVQESEEIVQLREDIVALKNEISDTIQTKEVNKCRKTRVVNALNEALAFTTQLKTNLGLKERKRSEAKLVYEKHEQEVMLLTEKLNRIKREISQVDNKLIGNPDLIRDQLDGLRKQCETENKKREEFQPIIKALVDETTILERVCTDIQKILGQLKNTVKGLDHVRSQTCPVDPAQEADSEEKSITEMQKKIANLMEQHARKVQEIQERETQQEAELQRVDDDRKQILNEIPEVKRTAAQLETKVFEAGEIICDMRTKLERIKESINKNKEIMEIQLPKRYEALQKKIEVFMQQIQDKLCSYPEPPLS